MEPFGRPEKPTMPSPLSLSNIATPGRLASILLLTVPLLLGADDSYLREIEEEAKRQATTLTIDQASPNSPGATTANTEATADRLASGLDRAGFEQALRETLPGTYALYQQFDDARRQKVYASYQNDNRLAGISEQVIQLISAKP